MESGGEGDRQGPLAATRDLASTVWEVAFDCEPKPVWYDLTKADLDQRTGLGNIQHQTSDRIRRAIEMQFADPLQLPAS